MRRGVLALCLVVVAGCTGVGGDATPPSTTTTASVTSTATPQDLPTVDAVQFDARAVDAYDLVEMTIDLTAGYENPFDQREVRLDATFTGPSGSTRSVPGFWDAAGSWLVRFTPDEPGSWDYAVTVTDARGTSAPVEGSLAVDPSTRPGFLRVGSDVDPGYSPRYLAYEDGTPWYGRGHADLGMSFGGAAPDGSGLRKMLAMADAGENYEMWWPSWTGNFIQNSYATYDAGPMRTIDYIVSQAEDNDIALVFTIWTHQYLRTGAHDWPEPRWEFNGFSHLTDTAGFFSDPEAWAWQENYYRYIIARWGYSPAIAMWQTITEINGTESYGQTDTWHARVNAYFQEHDPYRHPTTATGSGHWDWPAGHRLMDVAQVHLYEVFIDDPVVDGAIVADWTRRMWRRVDKPNWIGEYGVRGQQSYPEMMHYANWAALAAGAAMTPIEWNDGSSYGTFDAEMAADMRRFADFVDQVPLVAYRPRAVDVTTTDPAVRGWGVAGDHGGVVWIQDAALVGASLEDQRAGRDVASLDVVVEGLASGTWTVRPYDTWNGTWLAPISVTCEGTTCVIPVTDLHRDLALALER